MDHLAAMLAGQLALTAQLAVQLVRVRVAIRTSTPQTVHPADNASPQPLSATLHALRVRARLMAACVAAGCLHLRALSVLGPPSLQGVAVLNLKKISAKLL
jgi:hypothetical protein